MKSAGEMGEHRVARMVAGLLFLSALLLGPALAVFAAGEENFVAQETPYQAPEFNEIDPPSWLEPLQPLARLPLWGQAAVLSAGVAGMFFVVPMVGKWVWKLGENGRHEESGTGQ
jgi:hypothetical protein